MKLKMTEDGAHAVVADGKPVFVTDDGKEIPFDVPSAVAKISALNGEARGHREAKEAAEARLKAFEAITDPEAAVAALATVKNLKDGDLVQAGKVEEIKAAARKAADDQIAALTKASADEISKVRGELEAITGRYHGEKIANAFAGSKYLADKITVPPEMVKATFGSQYKVEADGKLVAYDGTGAKMYSLSRPGELADFEESIQMLIGTSPFRDSILKGSGAQGGGARGSQGGGSGDKTVNRAQWNALPPAEQVAKMKDGFTVVD
jgi:hypothetical protein